ncbi:stage II sporulation protein E [Heliophilum fasciatum]|nr:stage II sporulation protein E [Heliophilum fasciatum]
MWDEPKVYPFRRVASEGAAEGDWVRPEKMPEAKGVTWPWPTGKLLSKIKRTKEKAAGLRLAPITMRASMNIPAIVVTFLVGRAVMLDGFFVGGPAIVMATAWKRPQMLMPTLLLVLLAWASRLIIPDMASVTIQDPLGPTMLSRVLAIGLLAWVGRYGHRADWKAWQVGAVTAAVIALVEGSAALGTAEQLYRFIFIGFESLLAGWFAVAFAWGEQAWRREPGRWQGNETLGIAAICLLVLLGIPNISMGEITLLGIALRTVILLAAWTGGIYGGVISGVLAGFVPVLASLQPPITVALMALSGLLGGLLRGWAKIGVLIGFILGHVILSAYMFNEIAVKQALMETVIAGTMFFFWPVAMLRKVRAGVSSDVRSETASAAAQIKQAILPRLNEMSSLFGQLAQTFEEVTEAGEGPGKEQVEALLLRALQERVCAPCSSCGLCWDRDQARTEAYLRTILDQVHEEGAGAIKKLTPELTRRCTRLGEMAATIQCLLETFAVDRYWRMRMQESRGLVSAQFRGLSAWMGSLVKEGERWFAPGKIEDQLQNALAEHGVTIQSMRKADPWRVVVTGTGCGGAQHCASQIAPVAADVLGSPLMVGKRSCQLGKPCSFTLVAQKPWKLEVGMAQAGRHGNMVCGDTVRQWQISSHQQVVALSDGAGVGVRAARESAATLSLLEHFSRSGIPVDEAVRAVNAMIAMATDDESFATVDMAVIDQATLETEVFKLGATQSYLRRGRRVQALRISSLPLGIMKSIEVESIVVSLMQGDRLVLISDGILDGKKADDDWVASFLARVPAEEPQALADLILAESRATSRSQGGDDATVVVIAVMETPLLEDDDQDD